MIKVPWHKQKIKQEDNQFPTSVSMKVDEELLEKVIKMNIEEKKYDMLEDENDDDNDWNRVSI
jgi:hypothetical protein